MHQKRMYSSRSRYTTLLRPRSVFQGTHPYLGIHPTLPAQVATGQTFSHRPWGLRIHGCLLRELATTTMTTTSSNDNENGPGAHDI